MTRYRWYAVELPFPLVELLARLRSLQRNEGRDYWFGQKVGTKRRERFAFMWQSLVRITRLNRDGSTLNDVVNTISVIDFELFSAKRCVYLRLNDPPRNVRALMTALESIVGFGFCVKEVSFDSFSAGEVFADADEIRLVGIKLINAVFGSDTVGRLELASKNGINLKRVRALRDLVYKVDWAAYELFYKGVRGYVAISGNGSARIAGALAPRIVDYLERSLV